MSKHPKKQISLNLAATAAYMEKTAFSKFFKRTVGITFREFVQRWRTGMAVQLMLASDRDLYDVACEVGFHNLAAFERTFKKVTSFTPSEYRRRLLAETQVQVKSKNWDSKEQLVTTSDQHSTNNSSGGCIRVLV